MTFIVGLVIGVTAGAVAAYKNHEWIKEKVDALFPKKPTA